jgi:hypothetical protein
MFFVMTDRDLAGRQTLFLAALLFSFRDTLRNTLFPGDTVSKMKTVAKTFSGKDIGGQKGVVYDHCFGNK